MIGTGSSGIQSIPEIAKTAEHVTVFQRTPNYCKPLHNRPITPEEQADIKARYPEIFQRCRETVGGFLHGFVENTALDASDKEREAFYEDIWAKPGFARSGS